METENAPLAISRAWAAANGADRSIMAKPTTNRVIFENDVELVTFTVDGHLLHTHKATFAQRHSFDTWPNFESAKMAFEANLGHLRWRDE